jgi:hypothetical protein
MHVWITRRPQIGQAHPAEASLARGRRRGASLGLGGLSSTSYIQRCTSTFLQCTPFDTARTETMVSSTALALSAATLFFSSSVSAGLYPKSSAVLSVDARSYERLIAKSNHTSVSLYSGDKDRLCMNGRSLANSLQD